MKKYKTSTSKYDWEFIGLVVFALAFLIVFYLYVKIMSSPADVSKSPVIACNINEGSGNLYAGLLLISFIGLFTCGVRHIHPLKKL